MSELENLASRSYKTYKARLKASERLQARSRAWNACLLSLSVATTIASIALLTDARMYGAAGPTLLVCVAVMALVASLVVASLNYGSRSRDMFMNYRRIQRLSVEAETLLTEDNAPADEVRKLVERYEALLDDSENHTSADYKLADPGSGLSGWFPFRAQLLTAVPYIALVVPILIMCPIIDWAIRVGQ